MTARGLQRRMNAELLLRALPVPAWVVAATWAAARLVAPGAAWPLTVIAACGAAAFLGVWHRRRAWTEAHRAASSGTPLSARLWDAVIDDYRHIDPAAVLPVMQHVLEELLRVADTAKYADAVKRMKALLHVAQAAGAPEVGERIVAELRERFRRRTSLIARMDRARLP